jgi:mRNA interferase MazF
MTGRTASVARWDTVWVDLEPVRGSEQAGTFRPAIVVSSDAVHHVVPIVTVVPLTKAEAKARKVYPFEVLVPRGEGGTVYDSIAMPQQVRSITPGRIQRPMGRIRSGALRESLEDALLVVLGIELES